MLLAILIFSNTLIVQAATIQNSTQNKTYTTKMDENTKKCSKKEINDDLKNDRDKRAIPLWDFIDIGLAGVSWAEFLSKPSLASFGWAVLDTAAIAPLIPSTKYARVGSKYLITVDSIKDLARTSKGRNAIEAALSFSRKVIGFANKSLLDDHYQRHVVKELVYGPISKDGYLNIARELAESLPSSDILVKYRINGERIVYRKSTNDFLVHKADGTIKTLYKPTDGIDYFNRQY